jgi:hypothetical protein
MTKTILASLAVLTLASSAALAATHKTAHHHHTAKPTAAAPASPSPVVGASPGFWTGGVSKADHDMYIKNERDAGLAGKR